MTSETGIQDAAGTASVSREDAPKATGASTPTKLNADAPSFVPQSFPQAAAAPSEAPTVLKPADGGPVIVGPPIPPGGVSDKAHSNPSTHVHPAGTPDPSSEAGPSSSCSPEQEQNFAKAWLQVGRVTEIEDHPNSEKLIVVKVEIAPGEMRQVVAGLKKHVKKEDLLLKLVVLILNLKPAKLGGVASEAMILAGEGPLAGGTDEKDDQRVVKVLEPAMGSSIGDRVFLEGGAPSESPDKKLSSKVWEKVVPLLQIKGGHAHYAGRALVTSSGPVFVDDLPDGSSIH
jgi:methionine--tRNA ligase beta chain